MQEIFVDTAHIVALLNRRDQLHEEASRVALALYQLDDLFFVTTDAVLVEVFALRSKFGAGARRATVDFVAGLRRDARVRLVHQTPTLFDAGIALYGHRLDKSYSLVDCMSMVVCRDRKIREVLTADRDFEQEGFTILLR